MFLYGQSFFSYGRFFFISDLDFRIPVCSTYCNTVSVIYSVRLSGGNPISDIIRSLFLFLRAFMLGSQLQLNLSVKGGKFGLQLFQLILLLPYLARYLQPYKIKEYYSVLCSHSDLIFLESSTISRLSFTRSIVHLSNL